MEILKTVAELMALAARTAPKSGGKDFVEIKIVTGEAIARLADAMEDYGVSSGKKDFKRDAKGIRQSPVVVLVGIRGGTSVGVDCGACGAERCRDRAEHPGPEFPGPQCAFRLLDLGIALGSAVKTAGMHNADNRIMYRVGVAARRIGLTAADVVMGIPLSATGKNIFFDRAPGPEK